MCKPFELITPQSNVIPLIFDSPHSGSSFPSDFVSDVSASQLKTGWDAFIEELWEASTNFGAHLLHAKFSRMYIDPNRAPDDIDPEMLDETWEQCNPTKYSLRGMGLIRRFALPDVPMYTAPLTKKLISNRITKFYMPYHQKLTELLDTQYQKFGGVWHIDCHSMKSTGNQMNIDSGKPRPDIILGDNDGQCASNEFVSIVEQAFINRGYSVVRNDPYKGGYLINHYADVKNNRHSMQIEINRSLYMNEKTFERNENFENFKHDLSQISQEISYYVKEQIK